ncbi:TPA: tetratricopeptide repeat protein, partial [Candidatus Poribacteria bacterium]|nr:tetratricopeptide repeat protein [Candidatus Poribacteria bacterium]HEX30061.1 tetratricopeptide repeat protein [Candidatus Poribacteria bacterium]
MRGDVSMYKVSVCLIILAILASAILCGCGDKEADIGRKLLAQGKYEEAIIHLKGAVQRHPSDPDLHYSLGLAYSGAGRYDKAMDEFQVALSFAPDRTDIRYEMAKAAWKLGRRLVPLKTFIKILKSNPTPKQEAEIRELAAEPHPVLQLTNT